MILGKKERMMKMVMVRNDDDDDDDVDNNITLIGTYPIFDNSQSSLAYMK